MLTSRSECLHQSELPEDVDRSEAGTHRREQASNQTLPLLLPAFNNEFSLYIRDLLLVQLLKRHNNSHVIFCRDFYNYFPYVSFSYTISAIFYKLSSVENCGVSSDFQEKFQSLKYGVKLLRIGAAFSVLE